MSRKGMTSQSTMDDGATSDNPEDTLLQPRPEPEGLMSEAETAKTKGQPRGFLDLPAELRNRIYHLSLIKDGPVLQQTAPQKAEERAALAILRVNRQIRSEAFGIYYGLNRFHFCDKFDHERDIDAFLLSIGQQGLAYVQSIEFEEDEGGTCTSDEDACNCCDGWLVEMRLDRRAEKSLQGFWCTSDSISYGEVHKMIAVVQGGISATLSGLGISREMGE